MGPKQKKVIKGDAPAAQTSGAASATTAGPSQTASTATAPRAAS